MFSIDPPAPDPSLPAFMQRQQPKIRCESVTAGSASCYGVMKDTKILWFWGITKKSGEANMYPVQCDNVSGWQVDAVATGQVRGHNVSVIMFVMVYSI
jgi:hypothetical protein